MSDTHRGPLGRAWGVFLGILRQRCPHCGRGRLFRGPVTMNDPCPVCGLIIAREEGYFLGAMYVSYGLSVLFIGAIYWLVRSLWPRSGTLFDLGVTTLLYLPLVPIVFRYSRVLWIYFDRTICPSTVSAGTYEKARLQQSDDAPPAHR